MKGFFKKITTPASLVWRSQQIGFAFSRYGVAGGLGALGLEAGKRGLRSIGMSKASAVPFDAVFGRNLARTFAELGPTFIKLGQVLASRPDVVGDPIADELKVLFDRVPPIPFSQIQKILRQELGKQKVKESIKSIDPKALASASISQVHRACLEDGTPIILKVQKTGTAHLVRTDLQLLEGLMWPAHFLYPKLNLLQMFEDFKKATLAEIDYRIEGKNIERFHKNYQKLFSTSDIVFPRYFPELTTERVIAMEPMHGKKMAELKKGSTVARKVAAQTVTAVLEQIFDHGFFHADPHAGNLFFLEEEGRIGFIDLGMVGQLQPVDKRRFLKVLMSVLQRDRKSLAKALFELGTPGPKTKFPEFEKDIHKLLDEVKAGGIAKLRMDQMVGSLLAIARAHGIYIPNRYVLMMRSCLLIEGVAKSLDPNFSIFGVAKPVLAKSLLKTYNPLNYFKR